MLCPPRFVKSIKCFRDIGQRRIFSSLGPFWRESIYISGWGFLVNPKRPEKLLTTQPPHLHTRRNYPVQERRDLISGLLSVLTYLGSKEGFQIHHFFLKTFFILDLMIFTFQMQSIKCLFYFLNYFYLNTKLNLIVLKITYAEFQIIDSSIHQFLKAF